MHDLPLPEDNQHVLEAKNVALQHKFCKAGEEMGRSLTNLAAKLAQGQFLLFLREAYKVSELSVSDFEVTHSRTGKVYTVIQMLIGGLTCNCCIDCCIRIECRHMILVRNYLAIACSAKTTFRQDGFGTLVGNLAP